MDRAKRYALLITYALLLFFLLMLFVAMDIVERPDNPLTCKDAIPLIGWAIIFAIHHVLSFRHLQKNGRAFSFQLICILMDLNFLWYFRSLDLLGIEKSMLLWIVILRVGSLLLHIRKKR